MKRFFAFLAAAAMLVNFSACDKNDDGDGDDGNNNFIKIGTQTYELNGNMCVSGSMSSDEEGEEWISIYEIGFAENTIDSSAIMGGGFSGFAVSFGLMAGGVSASDAAAVIPEGTYVFPRDTDTMLGGLLIGSAMWTEIPEDFDYDEDVLEREYVYDIRDGNDGFTITVRRVSGDVYEFEWTGGIDDEGNAVSGYYKGTILFVSIEDIIDMDGELEL